MTERVVLPVLQLEQGSQDAYHQKILKGAKQFTEQTITPQSGTTSAAGSTTFSFQPPSQTTVIDRCMQITGRLRVTSASPLIRSNSSAFAHSLGGRFCTDADTFLFPSRKFVSIKTLGMTATNLSALNNHGVGSGVGRPTFTMMDSEATHKGYIDCATGNNLCARQFCLANSMQTIDVAINGTHFTASPTQYIHALMKYTTPEYRERVFKDTAHAPDRVPQLMMPAGMKMDPMNVEPDTFLGETPRGVIMDSGYVRTSNTEGTFGTYTEPLFISPLLQAHGHGMTNINQLDVTITWASGGQGLTSRALSALYCLNKGVNAATGGEGSNMDASDLTASFENLALKVRYYTPQRDIDIPAEISLPYSKLLTYTKAAAYGADFAETSVSGDNYRLDQIPSAVYIWIQAAESERARFEFASRADWLAPIRKLSIQWGNSVGLLANLSEQQLEKLAVDNGLDHVPYGVYSSSCLKLVFGKDLPLQEFETPGLRGDYNFAADVTYGSWGDIDRPVDKGNDAIANPTSASVMCMFVMNGKVTIRPQQCLTETGIVSLAQVEAAGTVPGSYEDLSEKDAVGGGLSGGSHVGGSHVGGGMPVMGKHSLHGKAHAKEPAVPTVKDIVASYVSRS